MVRNTKSVAVLFCIEGLYAVNGYRIERSLPKKQQILSMDSPDKRILSCLQQDASRTNHDIAEEVGLSPSACLKRVNRLRSSGIIDRVVALLNPEAIGACLYMVVEVIMEKDDKRLYKRFEDRVLLAPEVKQCYQVTG